jgi:CubicO group peptidase (beta-lactamase class C family)
VLLIARDGRVAYFESVGFLDPQSRTAMTKNAIFRIYSMSKAITSVAAMMLLEEGRLILDEPVAKYLPQLERLKVAADNRPGASVGRRPLALKHAVPSRPLT